MFTEPGLLTGHVYRTRVADTEARSRKRIVVRLANPYVPAAGGVGSTLMWVEGRSQAVLGTAHSATPTYGPEWQCVYPVVSPPV